MCRSFDEHPLKHPFLTRPGIENANLALEKNELDTVPEIELKELAKIYRKRGLDSNRAGGLFVWGEYRVRARSDKTRANSDGLLLIN